MAHPQFYFMRCSAQQSLLGSEEYHLAAASCPVDQQLDQIFTGLCQYQQVGGESLTDLASTPVRLARLPSPNSELAIVHSTTRRRAEGERASFFSHVILPEENGPSADVVLRTWGMGGKWGDATGWVSYGPDADQGELEKNLPKWEIPNTDKELIRLESLWDFFQGERPNMKRADYNRTVTPLRLFTDGLAPFRRRLMHSVLTAFLREQRIILRGEPGLAALLIFGVTQLLPEYLTTRLTFSTYESATSCKSSELDITNTTDSYDAKDTGQIFIDTLERQNASTRQRINVTDTASQYAKYAIATFSGVNSKLPDLKKLNLFWDVVSDRPGDADPSIQVFLEEWQRYYRLRSEADNTPLESKEIRFYITDSRYQGLLFDEPCAKVNQAKKHQAIDNINGNLLHWKQWWRELKKSEPENLPDDFYVPLTHRIRRRLWKYRLALIAPLALVVNTYICFFASIPPQDIANIPFYFFELQLVVLLLGTIALCAATEAIFVSRRKPSRDEILSYLRFRDSQPPARKSGKQRKND